MAILNECCNHYGELSESNRRILESLLQFRDDNLWSLARRIIVSPLPLITVEMAVFQVTKTPVSSCPDSFTLYRAIRHAVERRIRFEQCPIPLDMET